MNYFERRRLRKYSHEVLRHARHHRNMREDILSQELLEQVDAARKALKKQLQDKQWDALKENVSLLESLVTQIRPPCKHPGVRENVEVLVVAVSVAMAFRAYFLQPFAIPTGSMQPALYGIHSVDLEGRRWRDHVVLTPFNWLITGERYREVRAKHGGTIRALLTDQRKPGRMTFVVQVSGQTKPDVYYIPRDAVSLERNSFLARVVDVTRWRKGQNDENARRKLHNALVARERRGSLKPELKLSAELRVKAGDLLWRGIQVSGDHVFVNRVDWNFSKPERGEIMVFSTKGLNLNGPHYIKRMCGLPGETLSIDDPDLVINGEPVRQPEGIARMAAQEGLFEGYRCINPGATDPNAITSRQPLTSPDDKIVLTETEFFAMGDNSGSSLDSRYWGPVPAENLVGPSKIVYWPFSRRWGLNWRDLRQRK